MADPIQQLKELIEAKDKKIAELEKAVKDGGGVHHHYHYDRLCTLPHYFGQYQGNPYWYYQGNVSCQNTLGGQLGYVSTGGLASNQNIANQQQSAYSANLPFQSGIDWNLCR